jgi:iron-sulfur cluster assembly protein
LTPWLCSPEKYLSAAAPKGLSENISGYVESAGRQSGLKLILKTGAYVKAMIRVTPAARKEIRNYFKGRIPEPVRILSAGGCGGPRLAMNTDVIRDADMVFRHDGIDYVMDAGLLASVQPVTLDFGDCGFSIASRLDENIGL